MLFKRSKNGASTENKNLTKKTIVEVAEDDLEEKIEAMQKAINDIASDLDKRKNDEIKELKAQVSQLMGFIQDVVFKVLDRPVTPPPKSAVEQYQEKKGLAAVEAAAKK